MATDAVNTPTDIQSGRRWIRSYPPLLTLALAVFIGATVLPSALNLPNSQPSTVLEYAPVPPDDSTPPASTSGSLSSLGLSSSGGLTTGGLDQFNTSDRGTGSQKKPRVLDCVQQPTGLKQTEDPNSPPCVPFFDGDNGGATWQGVTRDEITVAIYQATYISDQEREGGDTSAGESTPPGGICDTEDPRGLNCSDPNTSIEHSVVVATKALARYFNSRFQTYGRHVHFYIYWAPCGAPCPASARRSQAADIWETLRPFAVIDKAFFGGNNDAFAESIARRRVSVYGSFGVLENSFYRKLAPNFWSFYPDVEHWADSYTNYVCEKVIGTRVAKAGETNTGDSLVGQIRRYALMYTTDPTYPGLKRFRELAEAAISRCIQQKGAPGEAIVERVTFPYAGYAKDFGDPKQQRYGVDNVAKMQDKEVNTILWLGGMETKTGFAARPAEFFPELVIAGDLVIDDLINGREQEQEFFRNARVVSKQLREDDFSKTPGRVAFRSSEPNGRQIHEYYANLYYRDFFTMFKAIQVAGPKLTPQAVDAGQHAIPRVKSISPFVAACFYDPGDYSCVKDAHVAWWDSDAPDPNGEPGNGCWRMVQEGKRYLAADWAQVGDPWVNGAGDPCNGVKGAVYNRL